MKKIYVILLVIVLAFGLFACNADNGDEFGNLSVEQQILLDELESYKLTGNEGQEVYIWGDWGVTYRDRYNRTIHLTSYNYSDISGYIDAQDNYGYFYANRDGSFEGKIIEGRGTQLLESSFLDDQVTTVELDSANTRSDFEDKTRFLGYIFPKYGEYSKNYDGTATLVTTKLSTMVKKDRKFIYDILRLTEQEVEDNKNQEVVLSYNLSKENRFEFTMNIKDFSIVDRSDPVNFEYELTYLLRERMYDQDIENLPSFSFPSDYQDCDIAYQPGNRIKMTVNRNSSTFIKLSLDAGTYSIHLAGNDTRYNEMDLYNEEMMVIDKIDYYYTIAEAGVYYLEIENNVSLETTGYLYINKGQDDSFKNGYGGSIGSMYPGDKKNFTLIQHAPEDGYLYFFSSSYFVFVITHDNNKYYTYPNRDLFIPVSKGEQVNITISSRTDQGTGFTNWRFVLEKPD